MSRLTLIIAGLSMIGLSVQYSLVYGKEFAGIMNGKAGYVIPKTIKYSFTLKNTSGKLLKDAEFRTYAPVKKTAFQKTVSIDSSHHYELKQDSVGNQILIFKFKQFAPYATKILTIRSDLLFSSVPGRVKKHASNTYLKAEKYVEINHPKIIDVSQQFYNKQPLNIAENIFNWVADNIRYEGYVKEDRGALYALEHKSGDCTEFMYLFTALLRANKIPARGIGGYVYSDDAILKSEDYHNWSEVFVNNTWNVVDPQKKVFMKNPDHYIAMRIITDDDAEIMGNSHRFMHSGHGLQVRMN